MTHRDLRQENRRLGIILFAVFLGLALMAVVFVILRKYGYA
ncbi:MAG: hypothetical protein ACREKF_00760 [Candidatus Methylomirabilales bacterium]